ncbi:xanthine dehydrogenase family protein molybdopterin-binding subunit [Rhodobacteraceae bacterium D3-12]|nr:xanthine dehydrogenase family protein molybdopterin-binding subunit [Rhodobacteraceae bacterium D3-12]
MIRPVIGMSMVRREDDRQLAGLGRFVEDVTHPGQLYAIFVRSTQAHAELIAVDTSSAASAPGVVQVLTGKDLSEIGALKPQWALATALTAGRPVLAREKVRHVGEPVAVVIAESEAQAIDAVAQVVVSYKALPSVLDQDEAMLATAPQIHDHIQSNHSGSFTRGTDDVDEILAKAHFVHTIELVNQRLVPSPLEGRAINARIDPLDGRLEIYVGHQLPHLFRRSVSEVLGVEENQIRVISPDVGGGFGAKMHFYPEDMVVAYAAITLKRPVKWSERRLEGRYATSHGRDHKTTITVGADVDGRIQALKLHSRANLGAYMSSMGGGVPTINVALFVLGTYNIPAAWVKIDCIYTNTTPTDAYRGAGRPEASYMIERTIDLLAREMGLDPFEVRARNLIEPKALPMRQVTGANLDSGDYQRVLSRAQQILKESDPVECPKGWLRGEGISFYTETCGVGPGELQSLVGFDRGGYESARVVIGSDASVTVLSGAHSHGQGHKTVFAQIAADALGIEFEKINVIQGDTDRVPQGVGTFNSRSIPVGGTAVREACDRLREKMRLIACSILRISVDALIEQDGGFGVVGEDRSISISEVCREAWIGHKSRQAGIGLEETEFFHPRAMSAPYGAHIVRVDVDPRTGEICLRDYIAVDDCGTVINPLLARGQVHGGVAQGLGQALFEDGTSDEFGFLPEDLPLPRFDHMPRLNTEHVEIPTWTNPLGAKGLGEAGTIAAPSALVNAVQDALWPIGVRNLEMPLTPERVLSAIDSAEVSK